MRPLHLLIVDDNKADRWWLRRTLKKSGIAFELDEAESGREAIERVRARGYDCVLLDYYLDDYNGLELVEPLRSSAPEGGLPIVILTGEGNEAVAVSAIKDGVQDYLTKGAVGPEVLEKTIRLAIEEVAEQLELDEHTQELERLSLYDGLTQLPNRQLLLERLGQAVLNAERSDSRFAVMMMDLNLFKEVNDTFGHQAGDRVLAAIGTRMGEIIRRSDTVARLGGDEFAAILVSTQSIEGAMVVAERLQEAIGRPLDLEATTVRVGVATGIAMYPEHGRDAETLLGHADLAMYQAKRSGTLFSVFCDESSREQRSAQIARAVQDSLHLHEITLEYQPKLSLATGGLVGVEALARWNHPALGVITPDEFVASAERSAVIFSLVEHIFERALQQYWEWVRQGRRIPIALNLPARVLEDPERLAWLSASAEAAGVLQQDLTFEVTEAAIMASPEPAYKTIEALAEAGFRISIDAFGAGYSSLELLKDLPLAELKIDQMFIQEAPSNPRCQAIVRSIVGLGEGLGLDVIAEGVETTQQVERILEAGCQLAQGFALARPMSGPALEDWTQGHLVGMPVIKCA